MKEPSAGPAGFPYRMRDLVRLTGVPAPTIHFYAQQGLLPSLQKTAGNQARYADATVARIGWIRALQQELRLPLRAIGWVLSRWGELPVDEIRTLQVLGRLAGEPDPAAPREELERLRERLGPGDIDCLRDLELIAPASEPVSESDLRLLELCAAARAAGFDEEAGFHIENLALYRDAVERLVEDEALRIFEPIIRRHDPEALRDLVVASFPFVNQLFALLHQRAVHHELQRWLELPGTATDTATA